jgi:type IV pilus assembly protein PilM
MFRNDNLVGVDIGSSSIKVCQLAESRKGLDLVRLGYEPLPPQTIVENHIQNASAIVESLARIFRDNGIKNRNVAMSFSGQSVIVRRIPVEMMTPAELAEHMPGEAEQHIPFDLKEVETAYEVMRRRPEATAIDVLLVAARRKDVQEYFQLARDAKLRPILIDIDAFAIERVVALGPGLPKDEVFAIINVGANLTTITIVVRGVSSFARDITLGGDLMCDRISKGIGCTFQDAEWIKCAGPYRPGVAPEVRSAIEAAADSIAAEVKRSLDFFINTSGEEGFSKVLLTGGTANLSAVAHAIERQTNVRVEPFSPMEQVKAAADIDENVLSARAPQLGVALGLALRKKNDGHVRFG